MECQTSAPEIAKTKEIEIVVNGESRRVPAGLNLRDLLVWLEIEPSRVAVEFNRSIVRQAGWTDIQVKNGSNLEIVHFVGGG